MADTVTQDAPASQQGPWTKYAAPQQGPWTKYAQQPAVDNEAVLAKNAQPTEFEKERTPQGSTLERVAEQIPSALKSITAPFSQMSDTVPNQTPQQIEEGTKAAEIRRGAITNIFHQPITKTLSQLYDPTGATAQATEGYPLSYKIARPLSRAVGLNPEAMEAEAKRSDTASIVTQAAVPAAMAAGGVAQEHVEPAVKATARTLARPVTAAAERLGLKAPEAAKSMTQAIQPGVNIPRAGESIEIAGPRLQQVKNAGLVKDAEGNPVAAFKGNADLLQGVKAAKAHVWDAIEQRTGSVEQLQTPTNEVGDAMRATISKRTREQFPEAAAKTEARAKTYDGMKSLRDVENAIQDANDDLRNYYKRSGPTDSPITQETAATEAEVRTLRTLLDKKVEDLTGAGVADLKREYGALRDVERAAAKQHAIETRQKGATLWEGLAALRAAGDFMSGNVLGAAKGAATMAVGRRLALVRSPSWLIDQAFQGRNAFPEAPGIEPPPGKPIAGLLPAAPLTTPAPADTSGIVRGPGPEIQPLAENRQLPPAGGTTGPRTVAGPRQFPIQRPAETPRPLTGLSASYQNAAAETAPPTMSSARAAAATAENPKSPEWLEGERQHELARLNSILRNPKATAEETSIARQQLADYEKPPKAPAGEKPAAPTLNRFSKDVLDRARGEMQGAVELGSNFERPGRYFDEYSEPIIGHLEKTEEGERPAGKWRGVKSSKHIIAQQFPWFKDMNISTIEKALARGKGAEYNRILEKVAENVEKDLAKPINRPEEK